MKFRRRRNVTMGQGGSKQCTFYRREVPHSEFFQIMFCVDAKLHGGARGRTKEDLQLIMDAPSTLMEHCERHGEVVLYCLYDNTTSSSLALSLFDGFCNHFSSAGMSSHPQEIYGKWRSIQIMLAEHSSNSNQTSCLQCGHVIMQACANKLEGHCWHCFLASTEVSDVPCKNLTAYFIACSQPRMSRFDYCRDCHEQYRPRSCRNTASCVVKCSKWAVPGKHGFCDKCCLQEAKRDVGKGLCSTFFNPRVRCGQLCSDGHSSFCQSCSISIMKREGTATRLLSARTRQPHLHPAAINLIGVSQVWARVFVILAE